MVKLAVQVPGSIAATVPEIVVVTVLVLSNIPLALFITGPEVNSNPALGVTVVLKA